MSLLGFEAKIFIVRLGIGGGDGNTVLYPQPPLNRETFSSVLVRLQTFVFFCKPKLLHNK